MARGIIFRIVISAIFSAGLFFPLSAYCDALKIGVIAPLTGSRASIGAEAKRGVEVALEELKSKQGKAVLQVVFEDSQGDPAKGVSAYKKLVADGIKFIITQNSNVSLAVEPLVNKDGVIQLAISTTSERYSTPHDNSFRVNGPTQPEAELIVHSIQKLTSKGAKIALVVMQDEYPNTLSKYVSQGLTQAKFQLVSDTFLPNDTDFRSIITKLSKAAIEAVVFLGYQAQAGAFVKQFRELGSPAKHIFVTTPVNNPEFFQAAREAAEGVLLSYPFVDLKHPAEQAFERSFGTHPNFFSASAYDGVMIADQALARCKYKFEVDCLRKSLFAVKDYYGLGGPKAFDAVYGDMQDRYELYVVQHGQFVRFQGNR